MRRKTSKDFSIRKTHTGSIAISSNDFIQMIREKKSKEIDDFSSGSLSIASYKKKLLSNRNRIREQINQQNFKHKSSFVVLNWMCSSFLNISEEARARRGKVLVSKYV